MEGYGKSMENNYLGRGMKFPPQINPATGRFETVENEQSIKQSIYLILMTQKRERFIRPDFGSNIMNYTFMDTGITMLNIMSREITSDILNNEPRIDDVRIDINPEVKSGCLIINIGYRIIKSNVRENLVFPFYLDTSWNESFDEDEMDI